MTTEQALELLRIMTGREITSTDAMGLAAAGLFGAALGCAAVLVYSIRTVRRLS